MRRFAFPGRSSMVIIRSRAARLIMVLGRSGGESNCLKRLGMRKQDGARCPCNGRFNGPLYKRRVR